MNTQSWARQRQARVVFVILAFFMLLGYLFYAQVIYVAPTCFDGKENGDERGVDCGGSCVPICKIDVIPPVIEWVQAFRIVDGQYNVVAYIRNDNATYGTAEFDYTIKLHDADGVITERAGTTILPPDNVYPIFEGRVMTNHRIPTEVTIDIEGDGKWLPATQAREQFTLIDRGKIQNADVLPRLQSSIKNNGLVAAKNVEIVTTIFDDADNPLTASRTFVDLPAETVTDVTFTWPEPIARVIRSCEIPTDVILAIDLSGSMNNEGGVPAQPLASVKSAAESFVSRLGGNDRVGVVTFATDGELVVPLSTQPATVAAKIAQLDIAPEEETGSTNSGAGLQLALAEFMTERHNPDARRVLVLLTDGLTNEPEPEPEAYALDYATRLKAGGVQIFAIGLGEDVNAQFLQSMASPDSFYRSISRNQIDSIYRSITEAICEVDPPKVDVIPKSSVNFIGLE